MEQKGLSEASDLTSAVHYLNKCFTLSTSDLVQISKEFQRAMTEGLFENKGPLKMLPSFLTTPTGKEKGQFLSVDFGGTNVRVLLLELHGCGKLTLKRWKSMPLRDRNGSYDYVSEKATGAELFDFIASQIENLIIADEVYSLGHTFSFPTRQTNINKAELINWTKEIKTRSVEGRDINGLLTEALHKRGLHNVKPVAIINDTVGTLLAAAYCDPYADIGSICGTGHNSCYIEPNPPNSYHSQIINMESGNFDRLSFNIYDDMLDRASAKPGKQRLEKMVAGHYIGELMRLIICDLIEKKLLFPDKIASISDFSLRKPYCLNAKDISFIMNDNTPNLTKLHSWVAKNWGIKDSSYKELSTLKSIASLVMKRSSRLVVSSYLGVLHHIDSSLSRKHTIAIDGSLYEKMPGYANSIRSALDEVLGGKANQVSLKLTKDGSGQGAAIAAAIAGTFVK